LPIACELDDEETLRRSRAVHLTTSRRDGYVTGWVLALSPLVVAVAVLQLVSMVLGGSPRLLRALDAGRPALRQIPTTTHLQGQLFHLDALNHDDPARTIAVIGSSSVVNGIDEGLLDRALAPHDAIGRRFGLNGLSAYELPLLKEYFVPRGRRAVVFAYNPWMFHAGLTRDVVARRWSTREALGLLRPSDVNVSDVPAFVSGAFAEAFPAFRYNEFLREQLWRWLRFELVAPRTPYDFPDEHGRTWARLSSLAAPAPLSDLEPRLRRWHVESDTSDETLGWRALSRFFALARERDVRVLVVPVPLMPADRWMYLQGIDVHRIDRRVDERCREAGISSLTRERLPEFGVDDFVDIAHLNSAGRAKYSAWVAAAIEDHLLTVPR
jgi:hypothetical protein